MSGGRALQFVLDLVQRVLSGSQTVGASFGVFREDGALLMVRSRHAAGWGIPGGCRRRGESIEETALRELFEETGITPEPDFELKTVIFETSPAHVTAIFKGRFVTPGQGGPTPRSSTRTRPHLRHRLLRRLEIMETAWLSPEELSALPMRTRHAELIAALNKP